jgi:TPR repeat protein
LGDHYREGDIVSQDLNLAFRWYSRGAELGDREAQNNLGTLFLDGLGCERARGSGIAGQSTCSAVFLTSKGGGGRLGCGGAPMTITVDIRPEVQSELARQAAMRGTPLATYAASLLEEAVHIPAGASAPVRSRSLREVFEAVRGLADDVDFSRQPTTDRPVDLA